MTQYGNGRKRGVNDERRYGAPADGHHKRRKFDKGNQVDRNYERDLSTWEQLQKELITIGDGNQDNKSKTQIVIQLKMLQEMCNVQVLRENDVHSLILECATSMGRKIPIYSTLAGLLCVEDQEFGVKLVLACSRQLQNDLDELFDQNEDALSPNYDRIRLTVRFLGELTNSGVIVAEDFAYILDTLQSACFIEQDDRNALKASRIGQSKDFLARVVLEALIFSGRTLYDLSESVLKDLILKCDKYVDAREKSAHHLDMIAMNAIVGESDAPGVDRISFLWQVIEDLRDSSWKSNPKCIIAPLKDFISVLVNCKALDVAIPVTGTTFNTSCSPPSNGLFRLFDKDSGPVAGFILKLDKCSYYVGRVYIEDTIVAYHPDPIEASTKLLSLSNHLSNTLLSDGKHEIKGEYLMLEVLFIEMFQKMSKQQFLLSYYCRIFVELIEKDASLISPALAVVVELFFRAIPDMTTSATDRFVHWFSYFLSNIDYKWPWANWNYILEDTTDDDPQRLFLSTVIEQCCRLSYLQNIETKIPENFKCLLPPAPTIVEKFASNSLDTDILPEELKLYEQLCTMMKAKDDVLSIFEQNCDLHDALRLFELFSTAVLSVGGATFSHTKTLIEHYALIFQTYGKHEEEQLCLFQCLSDMWQNSPQHMFLLVRLFISYGMLRSSTVGHWFFTQDVVEQYSWPYVWSILHTSVAISNEFIDLAVEGKQKESTILNLQDARQSMLLFVVENLVKLLEDHDGALDDPWYQSTHNRLQEFLLAFRVEFDSLVETEFPELVKSIKKKSIRAMFEMLENAY